MKPLIDSDVIRYEVGFAAQFGWDKDDSDEPVPWPIVQQMVDRKIEEICREAGGTEPPVLYLTDDKKMYAKRMALREKMGLPLEDYIPNFRDAIATVKPYKGTRKAEKPVHFDNLSAYILGAYDVKVAKGIEADDLICIDHTKDPDNTIICTRDKDLRQCPGWFFSWECGRQPSFGPTLIDEFGWIELSEDRKKLSGVGSKFFYSQVIMGDVVDNIPGLPRAGPVIAYEALQSATTTKECFDTCMAMYNKRYGADGWDMLEEQANLLWMVRELIDDKPVLWSPPYE